MILPLFLAVAVTLAAHASPAPSVDEVFGFQELQLEAEPNDPVEPVADSLGNKPGVERAYVEDVKMGERRLRVYVTLFHGEIEAIELQPEDNGDMVDLYKDLVNLYGRPTSKQALETRWDGRKARLVWTQVFGTSVITLTSKRLERELEAKNKN